MVMIVSDRNFYKGFLCKRCRNLNIVANGEKEELHIKRLTRRKVWRVKCTRQYKLRGNVKINLYIRSNNDIWST